MSRGRSQTPQAHERMEFPALSRTTCTYSATVSRRTKPSSPTRRQGRTIPPECKGHPSIPALLCSPKETENFVRIALQRLQMRARDAQRRLFLRSLRRHPEALFRILLARRGGCRTGQSFAKMFLELILAVVGRISRPPSATPKVAELQVHRWAIVQRANAHGQQAVRRRRAFLPPRGRDSRSIPRFA